MLNNPIRYSDPSGHGDSGECGPGEDCEKKERKPYIPIIKRKKSLSDPAYLFGLTEQELAKSQGNQGTTNNCAPNAIATSFNLFYGGNVNGNEIGSIIDKNYTPYYRVAPNQATLPFQQVHIINEISKEGKLGISATMGSKEKTELVNNLRNNKIIQIVTFIWVFTEPPNLQRGTSSTDYLAGINPPNGHTMVLGAFDLNHINENGQSTPWGFINSWGNVTNPGEKPNQIFWMADGQMKGYSVVLVTKQ